MCSVWLSGHPSLDRRLPVECGNLTVDGLDQHTRSESSKDILDFCRIFAHKLNTFTEDIIQNQFSKQALLQYDDKAVVSQAV